MTNQEFYDGLLERVGFVDGAEISHDGMCDNELAHERAEAVLSFIDLIRRHALPGRLVSEIKYRLLA